MVRQLQFVAEINVKVEAQVVQEVEFAQAAQLPMAKEQRAQEPEVRYSVLLQLQLVAETSVKLVSQAVQ